MCPGIMGTSGVTARARIQSMTSVGNSVIDFVGVWNIHRDRTIYREEKKKQIKGLFKIIL